MSNNQFTGTATLPQRNRKICQFNNDQYCISRARTFFIQYTVLHIIKLNLFRVPVRLHSGSSKFKFRRYFTIILYCDI